jgi:hypothetical protein
MSETKKTDENPVVKVAGYGAGAAVGIAAIAFLFMRPITDLGLFAVAIAVAAPCAMAWGVCVALIKGGNKPQ